LSKCVIDNSFKTKKQSLTKNQRKLAQKNLPIKSEIIGLVISFFPSGIVLIFILI